MAHQSKPWLCGEHQEHMIQPHNVIECCGPMLHRLLHICPSFFLSLTLSIIFVCANQQHVTLDYSRCSCNLENNAFIHVCLPIVHHYCFHIELIAHMLTQGSASMSSLAAANRCILASSVLSALMWQCWMEKPLPHKACPSLRAQLLMDRGGVPM